MYIQCSCTCMQCTCTMYTCIRTCIYIVCWVRSLDSDNPWIAQCMRCIQVHVHVHVHMCLVAQDCIFPISGVRMRSHKFVTPMQLYTCSCYKLNQPSQLVKLYGTGSKEFFLFTIHVFMYMYAVHHNHYMYAVYCVHIYMYVCMYMRKGLGIFLENREKPAATRG